MIKFSMIFLVSTMIFMVVQNSQKSSILLKKELVENWIAIAHEPVWKTLFYHNNFSKLSEKNIYLSENKDVTVEIHQLDIASLKICIEKENNQMHEDLFICDITDRKTAKNRFALIRNTKECISLYLNRASIVMRNVTSNLIKEIVFGVEQIDIYPLTGYIYFKTAANRMLLQGVLHKKKNVLS